MRWFRRKPKPKTVQVNEYEAFYHMRQTHQPHAGALSYAFAPQRLLPPQNPFGHGILFPSARVLPLQPLIAHNAGTQSGLGGVVAGQLVLQPLVVSVGTGGNL